MRRHRAVWRGALVVSSAMLLGGCTTVVDGSAVKAPRPAGADTEAAACTEVAAPLTPVTRRDPAEPTLKIPQPAGWTRNKQLDSRLIRYAMRNEGLVAESFAPTAVVTLESSRAGIDEHQPIDAAKNALRGIAVGDVRSSPGTVCGHLAETVSYHARALGPVPAREVTALITVATCDDTTYVAVVTVQSTRPDEPSYVADSRTILTGFQLLSPGAG